MKVPGWLYLNPFEQPPRRRSAIARELLSSKYRQRVKRSRKLYSRKRRRAQELTQW